MLGKTEKGLQYNIVNEKDLHVSILKKGVISGVYDKHKQLRIEDNWIYRIAGKFGEH